MGLFYCPDWDSMLKKYEIKINVYSKPEIYRGFVMRARYPMFVLVICICCLVIPYHARTAEEANICPKPYIKTIIPWAARPGELVKIQGGKFGVKRGEVIFNQELFFEPEVKAEILSWTFHRIWVIVPKSATSGPVFVRVPCGSDSNKLDFKVNK
jgi:hypothetical protein